MGLNGVVTDAQLGAYFACRCFSAVAALRFRPADMARVDVCDGVMDTSVRYSFGNAELCLKVYRSCLGRRPAGVCYQHEHMLLFFVLHYEFRSFCSDYGRMSV